MSTCRNAGLKSWLKGLMFRHIHGMMSCREFEEFVQAYVDEELPVQQRRVFERHIRLCRECWDYLAAYRQTVELARSVTTPDEPPVARDIPEDLVKAILEARKA